MTEMLAELLVPFSYNYMLKAMWVSALVGGVCAFLSAYLMLKGWSLMGDALGHSIVPGVAAAYILGAPFAVGAFFAAEQLLLALVGGVLGYALGVVLARALGIGIFGVAPTLRWILLPIVLVLAAVVALLGSLLPLGRASRVDPAPVLRGE